MAQIRMKKSGDGMYITDINFEQPPLVSQIFFLTYTPGVARPVRLAPPALDMLILKHRQHEEAWPLRVIMDAFCEMWHDYDSRLKAALVQLYESFSI